MRGTPPRGPFTHTTLAKCVTESLRHAVGEWHLVVVMRTITQQRVVRMGWIWGMATDAYHGE